MAETTDGTADPRVLVAGGPLSSVAEVTDLVGNAWYQGAEWVAVPVDRLPADFFRLRSGFAGEVLQKFANYRVGLAVIGDVSAQTDASTAFEDLVRETNSGGQVWFLPDLAALASRLGGEGTSKPVA